MLPLQGIKVIEMGQNLAGPYAGFIMAMMGADVIKVERPGSGDDARAWGPPFVNDAGALFQAVNVNKKSITIDFKDDRDREKLFQLIEAADVVVQNLRPGVMEELGFNADILRNLNPALIYCAMGAYGHKGPMKHEPGYEPIVQAFGGLMMVSGEEGAPPIRLGTQALDQGSAMWAVMGILAGLTARATSGEGCVVDTSLFETAMGWITIAHSTFNASGHPPARHPTGSARVVPFEAFETSDGPLIIAAANNRLFERLSTALGQPNWADDDRFKTNADRQENREALKALMEAELGQHDRAYWGEALSTAKVPSAPVQTIPEVSVHEQTQAIDMIQQVPGLDFQTMSIPLSFNGERPKIERAAPALGEHNDEVS
jgi:crotonobetainyl-CoA:carnitine CoA-transferase CaiB-like acyl-CoA transferase